MQKLLVWRGWWRAVGVGLGIACALALSPAPAVAGGIWTGSFSTDEVVHTENGDGSVVDTHAIFKASLSGGRPYAYLGESYTLTAMHDDITYDASSRTTSGSCVTTGTEHESVSSTDATNQLQVEKAPDGSYVLSLAGGSAGTPRTRHDEKDCVGAAPEQSDVNLGGGVSGSMRTPDVLASGVTVGSPVDGSSRHLAGSYSYDACKVGASTPCGPNDSDVRTYTWDLTMTCATEPQDQNGNCVADPTECPTPPAHVVGLSTDHRPQLDARAVHAHDTIAIGGTLVVPSQGWAHLEVNGSGLLDLGESRVRLVCGKPPLLSAGAAHFKSSKGAIDTKQTSFVATGAKTDVDMLVGPQLTRIWVRSGTGRVTTPGTGDQFGTMDLLPGDKLLAHSGRLPQLDTWPFAPARDLRRATAADHLPAFWDDGRPCSVGCRPAGAIAGWPLKPFHQQHPLRAGLNERRRANMHLGIDIQAADGSPVYAIQPGTASVTAVGTIDERVQVGNYIYWHIRHRVSNGQHVIPYKTVLGTVIKTAGHLHLSEVQGGYLNPLRPGGRVLTPYADTAPPVIGAPKIRKDRSGFHVIVKAFDPQSFRELIKYRTPVLALAALAYRAFDASGRDVTGLRWALRGSQHYPDGDRFVIYARGAHTRGWSCFADRLSCPPDWIYNLTDGLTPPIPSSARKLDIYAYDWAGNVTVRETALR